MHPGCKARNSLCCREQHQADAAAMPRRPVQNSGVPSVPNDVADDPVGRLDTVQKRHALPVAMRLGPDRRPVRRIVAASEVDNVLRSDEEGDQRRRWQQGRLALVLGQRGLGRRRQLPCLYTRPVEAPTGQRRAGATLRRVRPTRRERAMERRVRSDRREDHPDEPDSIDSR